ncbi:hypothetical protein POM88_049238 [Heracleum sosnowskyi]|uniref:Uncharacterized protein n=1 Tax=Heracleum sosnowskyi TaxID=360622 RepID=A0AAD8M1D4_9APIA|nr:hypothetical protein POM88_049238 [Heracleum sosnowskyi]
MMKDLYLRMNDTDDEFKVIYIKDLSSDNLELMEDEFYYMPWFLDDYGDLPWSVHNYDEGCSLPKELESNVFPFRPYGVPKEFRNCLLILSTTMEVLSGKHLILLKYCQENI